MGKGDRRTRRGKIGRKSCGRALPPNPDKPEAVAVAAPPAKKPPAKKPTKKAAT
jgi:ribosomal small subunit protein bTHX